MPQLEWNLGKVMGVMKINKQYFYTREMSSCIGECNSHWHLCVAASRRQFLIPVSCSNHHCNHCNHCHLFIVMITYHLHHHLHNYHCFYHLQFHTCTITFCCSIITCNIINIFANHHHHCCCRHHPRHRHHHHYRHHHNHHCHYHPRGVGAPFQLKF